MSLTTTFQFHGQLADFLTSHAYGKRRRIFDFPTTVKDAVESQGPPHPEVGMILANGAAVCFGYQLQHGDVIDVFPHRAGPAGGYNPLPGLLPPGEPTFLLDVHLGVLARYLRALGYDTRYTAKDPGDASLAEMARRENRVLLSRDLGLLKRAKVTHGYYPRATKPLAQLRETVSRYSLMKLARPFRLCVHCNSPTKSVLKRDIVHRLPERTRLAFDAFRHCLDCDRIYWKGSHYERMKAMMDSL